MIRGALALWLIGATALSAQVSTSPTALLRSLDKVSGVVRDLEVTQGEEVQVGRLKLILSECRFPTDNPSGDGYAYLTIEDEGRGEPVFQGWMIASSPGLSALDHPRYDVWVLRCKSS